MFNINVHYNIKLVYTDYIGCTTIDDGNIVRLIKTAEQ